MPTRNRRKDYEEYVHPLNPSAVAVQIEGVVKWSVCGKIDWPVTVTVTVSVSDWQSDSTRCFPSNPIHAINWPASAARHPSAGWMVGQRLQTLTHHTHITGMTPLLLLSPLTPTRHCILQVRPGSRSAIKQRGGLAGPFRTYVHKKTCNWFIKCVLNL